MPVTLGTYGDNGPGGWSTFTHATGKIIYVAQASSGGSDSNDGLSVGAPVLTLSHAKGLLTDNESDWMLLKEDDTWTDQSIGNVGKSGKDAANPMLFGSYHPSQPGVANPAIGARPIVKMNSAVDGASGIGSLGNLPLSGNFIAVVNIDFYNYTRDPANIGAGFDGSNNSMSCITFGNASQWLLIEGCALRFGHDNIDMDHSDGISASNTYFRRNVVVDSWWNFSQFSQGLHAVKNYGDFFIEENIFDHNGWNETLITPATATMTIASPCVVTWSSNPVFNLCGITFHDNGDTLPTGLSFATEYLVANYGVDGAGKFRLTSGRTTASRFSISGTTLTVDTTATFTGTITATTLVATGISGTIAVNNILVGAGVAASTFITADLGGGSYTVSVSQNVGPVAMTTGAQFLGTTFSVGDWLHQDSGEVIAAGTHIVSGSGLTWTVSVSQTFALANCNGYPEKITTGSQSGIHKIAWDGALSAKVNAGFNHNVYIDTNNDPLTFRGNIVARGAVSFEDRVGGITQNNIFAGNNDTGFTSGSSSITSQNAVTGEQVNSFLGATNGLNQIAGLNCTFTDNVIVNSTGGTVATDTRSGGEQAHDDAVRFTLANPCVASFRTSRIYENQPLKFNSDTGGTPPASIVFGTIYYAKSANIPSGNPYTGTCQLSLTPGGAAISTLGQSQSGLFGYESLSQGCTISGNIVYNFGSKASNITATSGNTIGTNQDFDLGDSLPGNWADATRDVSHYNASLGGTATLAAFLTTARTQQQKLSWSAAYTATAINAYIRAGFGLFSHGARGHNRWRNL